MKVLKGYTNKIRLLTLPVLPLLMSLALMMMVVVGVNTTAVVANAQCSVYTFNGITGQLDCVTASGVNVTTFATDGNERMRITQGGNVLIGTTTDDGVNLFQVDGSGAFATSVVAPLVTNAGTLGLSATGANVITFSTNGSERVHIKSDGMVGVWTNDPGRPLHVDVGSLTNDGMRIGRSAATNSPYADFMLNTVGTPYFSIQSGDGISYRALALNPSGGNLLVGTTTDDGSSKLQVAGTILSGTTSGGILKLADTTAVTGSSLRVTQVGTRTSFNVYDASGNFAGTPFNIFQLTNSITVGGGTDGNYRFDIQSSGSAGTARFYDQTATTGATSFVVRAGEGQSTTALQTWQDNAGSVLASMGSDGVLNIYSIGTITDIRRSTGLVNGSIPALTEHWASGSATPTSYSRLGGFQGNFSGGSKVSYGLFGDGVFLDFFTVGAYSVKLSPNQSTKIEANNTGIGFFGVTPVARAAALTAADAGALNTGDAGSDTVIGNIRTRLGELETKLQAYGLLN